MKQMINLASDRDKLCSREKALKYISYNKKKRERKNTVMTTAQKTSLFQ